MTPAGCAVDPGGPLYAVTVAASGIGETWVCYLLGSAVEVVLLVAITVTAWR